MSKELPRSRKQEVEDLLVHYEQAGKADLLEFWAKLVAEEAELVHELSVENVALKSLMSTYGLTMTPILATTDDE